MDYSNASSYKTAKGLNIGAPMPMTTRAICKQLAYLFSFHMRTDKVQDESAIDCEWIDYDCITCARHNSHPRGNENTINSLFFLFYRFSLIQC